MDAQGRCSCAFFSNSTFPVDASIKTADGAGSSSAESAVTLVENVISATTAARKQAAILLPFISDTS